MSPPRIEQLLIDRADGLYQSAQGLAASVSSAVDALVASLTNGGKVLVAASGVSSAMGDVFMHHWLGHVERARPGLPAVRLATALAGPDGGSLALRQLQALGQAGDVLLLLTTQLADDQAALMEAAHDHDMVVLLLAPTQDAPPAALRETDVMMPLDAHRVPHMLETQLTIVHCLCDGIDAQLLGEPEI